MKRLVLSANIGSSCRVLMASWVLVFFLPLAALAAPITVPTSLNPGDQYRLLFLTIGKTNATSTNINTYNTFVTNDALAQPELVALGTTWKAVGSTAAVAARDNTGTLPAFAGGSLGVPIFLLNDTLLANSNDHLWSANVSAP